MKWKPVLEFIASRGWTRVGEAEWLELKTAFPGIAASALARTGIPVDQPFRGVEQHTFDELEISLLEMAEVYRSRPELRAFTRKQVIAAKDRARFASRNRRVDEAARRRKAEMLEWMLVWLDDPAMFETWARLRQTELRRVRPGEVEAGVQPSGYAEKDNLIRRTDVQPENVGDPGDGEETSES